MLKVSLNPSDSLKASQALKSLVSQGQNANVLLAVLNHNVKDGFVRHAQHDGDVWLKTVNLFNNINSLGKCAKTDSLALLKKAYSELELKGSLGKKTKVELLNAGTQAQIVRESCLFKHIKTDEPLPEYFTNLIHEAVKKQKDKQDNESLERVNKAEKAFGDLSINEKAALLAKLQFELKGQLEEMPSFKPKVELSPIVDMFVSELGIDQTFAEQMEQAGFTTLDEVAYVKPEGWTGLNKRKAKVAQTRAHKIVLERMAQEVAEQVA